MKAGVWDINERQIVLGWVHETRWEESYNLSKIPALPESAESLFPGDLVFQTLCSHKRPRFYPWSGASVIPRQQQELHAHAKNSMPSRAQEQQKVMPKVTQNSKFL